MSRVDYREDAGSTLPLIAAFAALGIAVALVVTAASSLYLEHKRLLDTADGAALAAAESFDFDAVRVEGDSVRPRVTDAEIGGAVRAYLASVPDRATAVVVTSAHTEDGLTATVSLASVWRPPILVSLLPDGVPIDVTVTARSVFR